MKARSVRKLDPRASLADGAERIIRARLAELHSFVPAALDPAEQRALHDMRIAAKRLRYLLELCGFCFGAYAPTAAKRTKELQDLLGEIHDCDVMLPRVLGEVAELRARDAAALLREAGAVDDLEPSLVRDAPHRDAYTGLELYAAYLQGRRALLFARFEATWLALRRRGFRARLEHALSERSQPDSGPAIAVERRRRSPERRLDELQHAARGVLAARASIPDAPADANGEGLVHHTDAVPE
jgi:CHAD domain-containing protein